MSYELGSTGYKGKPISDLSTNEEKKYSQQLLRVMNSQESFQTSQSNNNM